VDKRGMEMWQIVLMVLAVLVLIAFLIWYNSLGNTTDSLLGKLGGLF
tara:strand:+ start:2847 stop:2987 length:141 start_codon:yes stop_codon:yes gene_type:complete